jgi:SagB-type dehydrogenase family enzyme
MIPLDDPTSLSSLFHLNSEPWVNKDAYPSALGPQEFKVPDAVLTEVALPRLTGSPFAKMVRLRQSCRAFSPRRLSIDAPASLLSAAYGMVGPSSGSGDRLYRRAVPSAGGLFPLELYAFIRRTDGLDDGLYHYDVPAHALQLTAAGDLFPALDRVFYTYPCIRDANLVIAFAAVFKRSQKKYGPRGYRYVLLEAGHSAQNVCLQAVEMGVSTLCMGGFVDTDLNALLGLTVPDEGVVYAVAAGYPA